MFKTKKRFRNFQLIVILFLAICIFMTFLVMGFTIHLTFTDGTNQKVIRTVVFKGLNHSSTGNDKTFTTGLGHADDYGIGLEATAISGIVFAIIILTSAIISAFSKLAEKPVVVVVQSCVVAIFIILIVALVLLNKLIKSPTVFNEFSLNNHPKISFDEMSLMFPIIALILIPIYLCLAIYWEWKKSWDDDSFN